MYMLQLIFFRLVWYGLTGGYCSLRFDFVEATDNYSSLDEEK